MILTKEQRTSLIYALSMEDIKVWRLMQCTDGELIEAAKSYGIKVYSEK